jgi:hypothetical protein
MLAVAQRCVLIKVTKDLPRHSRTTLGMLLRWYATWAIVGMVIVLALAIGLHAVNALSVASVRVAGLVALPLLLAAIVVAWARIEPSYTAQQVRAKLTSRSGLSTLHELFEKRRKPKP